jgi:hypothetical protein
VPRIVGVMHLAHRIFEVFEHLNLDLTWLVEERIFPKCDQVLVSWPRGVESRLT